MHVMEASTSAAVICGLAYLSIQSLRTWQRFVTYGQVDDEDLYSEIPIVHVATASRMSSSVKQQHGLKSLQVGTIIHVAKRRTIEPQVLITQKAIRKERKFRI